MKKLIEILAMYKSLNWSFWGVVILAFFIGFLIPSGADELPASEVISEHEHDQKWTCSMHPQVKLPDPGQCPICFMDLIPLESGSPEISENQLQISESAVALADISTSTVTRGRGEREVRLSGKLTQDETRVKRISAWIPGRLDRLFVDYTGTSVRQGEHLFEIYSPDLLAAQEELIQSGSQLQRLSSDDAVGRRTFQATLTAAREKLTLLGLSEDQIRSIESNRSTSKTLTVHSPISGIVLEKNAFEGSYVKTGSPVYTIADLSQLWLILDAYESDLSWLNYGQEILFEAEAHPGQSYKGIISFIDPSLNESTRTVRVRANVPNPNGMLKPGMFVRAMVKARLNHEGVVVSNDLAGKWIGPMHPEIIRSQPGDCDICGMPLVPSETLGFVKGSGDDRQPLLIPISSVLITGPRAVVYVQLPGTVEPTFELREVTLGPRTSDHYVVLAGLEEGERVVTHGSFKIDSAMQIAAKPSMMNPKGGVSSTGHENHRGMTPMNPVEEKVESVPVSSDVLQHFTPIYARYFDMQRALAEDDYAGALRSGRAFANSISTVALDVDLSSHALQAWQRIQDQFAMELNQIDHWQDIESARSAFGNISNSILTLQKQFGHSDNSTIYEVFCPMAFNNRGASWLQHRNTVNNPYFGAKMLRCGEVRAQFAAQVD